jgi:hypothetical protein
MTVCAFTVFFQGGLRPSYCVNIFSLDLYAFSMILELGISGQHAHSQDVIRFSCTRVERIQSSEQNSTYHLQAREGYLTGFVPQ